MLLKKATLKQKALMQALQATSDLYEQAAAAGALWPTIRGQRCQWSRLRNLGLIEWVRHEDLRQCHHVVTDAGVAALTEE